MSKPIYVNRKTDSSTHPGTDTSMTLPEFLPVTREEARRRGWHDVDVVLVTGDAYVDHPSFGAAVIGRVLEQAGYRVGIVAMPDTRNPGCLMEFGRPRLFFGITSGNVDSMLSRYTAFKRPRSDDPFAPGGVAGAKPDHAVIAYCNMVKAVCKDVPIVLGGIEASMRRIVHYDFMDNKLRRSILEDSKADILVYGMGEKTIQEIAARLADGRDLEGIAGTVIMSRTCPADAVQLPGEEGAMASASELLACYRTFYNAQKQLLAQPCGKRWLVHYPTRDETSAGLDAMYALPYCYAPHPSYREPIPAFDMIKDSITSHRGCVSGCAFCSVFLHQGRRIVSRSKASILAEVKRRAALPAFRGHITDIGGPSANMYGYSCSKGWDCNRSSCLFPKLCPNLRAQSTIWIDLMDDALRIPGVKHVTVGSGIRYDVLMHDPNYRQVLRRLLEKHVSGQLKIAPEHTVPGVLQAMHKAPVASLKDFMGDFRQACSEVGRKLYVLPYLMSCHPGCRMEDMNRMKQEIQEVFGFIPQQVQAFIPLPMTISSIIYLTGTDPLGDSGIFCEHDPNRRRAQHDIFFQHRKQEKDVTAGRKKKRR